MSTIRQDSLLSGGNADFLKARYLCLVGTDRSIGRALAGIARNELGVSKVPWTDVEATRAHRAWLRIHWPSQYERALGAADAFGIAPDDDRYELSFLFYQWMVPGCSCAFVPAEHTANGHAVLFRNYDFSTGTVHEVMGREPPQGAPPATSRPFVIDSLSPLAYRCLFTTSYELLGGCVDGINEHGLSVALLSSVDVLRGPGAYRPLGHNGVGLHEIQLPRFVLETCRDAREARRALVTLPQYYQHVPCHYLVADPTGDAFVWASAANPDAPLRLDRKPGEPLVITNHLPTETRAEGAPREESERRLERLRFALRAAGDRADRRALRAAVDTVAATAPAGRGMYGGPSVTRTLWHAAYDLQERSMTIDFYLGESSDGAIRRSPPRHLSIDAAGSGERRPDSAEPRALEGC